MKGNFSKVFFKQKLNYNAVLHQQGKVLLDRDWNEQVNIIQSWQDLSSQDVIGAGVPAIPVTEYENFKIKDDTIILKSDNELEFEITPGRLWADVLPIFLEKSKLIATPLFSQSQTTPPTKAILFLELWREEINAFQEPKILLEPALGGPDTTERINLAFAFRFYDYSHITTLNVDKITCQNVFSVIKKNEDIINDLYPDKGKLTVDLERTIEHECVDDDDCDDCPPVVQGGYTGLEHRLYRIENAKLNDDITRNWFKWSRFNGELVGRGIFDEKDDDPDKIVGELTGNIPAIINSGLTSFYLEVMHYNDNLGIWEPVFGAMDVELTADDRLEFRKDKIMLEKGVDWLTDFEDPSGDKSVFFRLWNGIQPIDKFNTPSELENGITLEFRGNIFRPGDFWLFELRVDQTNTKNLPNIDIPHGIEYHLVPFALIDVVGPNINISDCRKLFHPLTNQKICTTFTVGDGIISQGDFNNIKTAHDNLPVEGGLIHLLPGEHEFNLEIEKNNIEIIGCGNRTVIKPSIESVDGDGNIVRKDEPIFDLDDVQNINLKNMKIEKLNAASAIKINNVNLTNTEIPNIEINGINFTTDESSIKISNANGIIIKNCKISSSTDVAIECNNTSQIYIIENKITSDSTDQRTLEFLVSSQIFLVNNQIISENNDSIYIKEANTIIMNGNTINSKSNRGILVEKGVEGNDNEFTSDLLIKGNFITTEEMSIDVNDVNRVNIEDNNITSKSNSPISVIGGINIKIFQNWIHIDESTNDKNSISIKNSVSNNPSYNIRIFDNSILSQRKNCISISGAKKIDIYDNILYSVANNVIEVKHDSEHEKQAEDIQIKNNDIKANQHSIHITGSIYVKIHENRLTSEANNAIEIVYEENNETKYIDISNNIFETKNSSVLISGCNNINIHENIIRLTSNISDAILIQPLLIGTTLYIPENISLMGNELSVNSHKAIKIDQGKYININNNKIESQSTNENIIQIYGGNQIFINENKISLTQSNNPAIQIEGKIDANNDSFIQSQHIQINKNTLKSSDLSLSIHGGKNFQIEGNIIESMNNTAIHIKPALKNDVVYLSENIQLVDNFLISKDINIKIIGGKHLTIKGNQLESSNQIPNSIEISNYTNDPIDEKSRKINISKNSIKQMGISINNGVNITIDQNNIIQSPFNAITLDGGVSFLYIRNNIVSSKSTTIDIINGDDIDIEGNKLNTIDSETDNILISSSSSRIQILNNELKSNQNGINLSGCSSIKIDGNTLKSLSDASPSRCIFVDSNSSNIQIINNHLEFSGHSVEVVDSFKINILDNIIYPKNISSNADNHALIIMNSISPSPPLPENSIIKISGNDISSSGNAILIKKGNHIFIDNNTLKSENSVTVPDTIKIETNVFYVNITNNFIISKGILINIGEGENIHVSDNTLKHLTTASTKNSIYSNGANILSIKNNNIESTGIPILIKNGDQIKITKNTVRNNKPNNNSLEIINCEIVQINNNNLFSSNIAIKLLKSEDCKIVDNYISYIDSNSENPVINYSHGLFVKAINCKITGNKIIAKIKQNIDERGNLLGISYPYYGGIIIAGGSERITINDNQIQGGFGNGISLGNHSSLIEDIVTDEDFYAYIYDIEINGNVISNMRLSGIGTPDLDEIALSRIKELPFVDLTGNKIVNLSIKGNYIHHCAQYLPQQGVTLYEENSQGFGGISLKACENGEIIHNIIQDNGLNLQKSLSVTGIIVHFGELLTISYNKILNTIQDINLESEAKLLGKYSAGIAILTVVPPTLEGAYTFKTQAIQIHENIIHQNIGLALRIDALGPISVLNNTFESRTTKINDEQNQDAGTVYINNLGGNFNPGIYSDELKYILQYLAVDPILDPQPTAKSLTEKIIKAGHKTVAIIYSLKSNYQAIRESLYSQIKKSEKIEIERSFLIETVLTNFEDVVESLYKTFNNIQALVIIASSKDTTDFLKKLEPSNTLPFSYTLFEDIEILDDTAIPWTDEFSFFDPSSKLDYQSFQPIIMKWPIFCRPDNILRKFPRGFVMYNNNQITFHDNANSASKTVQIVYTKDDLEFSGNQIVGSTNNDKLILNTLLYGFTLRATNNRFIDNGSPQKDISLMTIGVLLNSTTYNQSDYCIIPFSLFDSNVQDISDQNTYQVGNQIIKISKSICKNFMYTETMKDLKRKLMNIVR
ncbi:MAG: right-handed parallel beta-helix repeat-containing protein [Candidatus Hodarchaeales archaeon]|jgi:hypothetical protein